MSDRLHPHGRFRPDGAWPAFSEPTPSMLGVFTLKRDIEYVDPAGWIVPLKAGFSTDKATLPRITLPFFGKAGPENTAAPFHDWLYRHHSDRWLFHEHLGEYRAITRKRADVILYHACIMCGCSPTRAALIYAGVRVGGWFIWRRSGFKSRAIGRAYIDSIHDKFRNV